MHKVSKNLLLGVIVAALISGCASNASKQQEKTALQNATDRLEAHSRALLEEQAEIRRRFQSLQPEPPKVEPVKPTYDPLEGIKVTLDVEDTSVHHVLRALADQVNMDLVIHPNLVEVPNRISVHFSNAEASRVFREVLRVSDVSGEIENNMLVVNPMDERVFNLDFMETTTTMSLSAGGDVLGAAGGSSGLGETSGTTVGNALTGNFRLEGSSAQNINPYDALEDMLARLIGAQEARLGANVDAATSVEEVSKIATVDSARRSDTPLYSLNRITGTLYVRAKPSVLETVSELVGRYREVLSRQILIEAQVLEISLRDSFSYGVDWSFLQDRVATTFGPSGSEIGGVESSTPDLTQGSRSVTIPGRTLEALGDSFLGASYFGTDFGISIELLKQFGDVTVLSNPTLRSKHGQPALISVGRSSTFVSETGSTIVPSAGTSTITQEVQTSSVFDGLLVGLQPFIADDGTITMIIHPIQSDVDEDSLALVDVGGETRLSLPRVDLKELSTTIRLRDGDLIMLGGLIDSNKSRNDDEVPGISRIPIFGKLFESSNRIDVTRELVIVLKVTEV